MCTCLDILKSLSVEQWFFEEQIVCDQLQTLSVNDCDEDSVLIHIYSSVLRFRNCDTALEALFSRIEIQKIQVFRKL